MVSKVVEGSPAEEKTETPAFEKKEDAKKVPMKKGGKKVSPAQAKALANFLNKGKKAAPVAPGKTDAEDMVDGGVDEATEKN